MRLPRSSSSGSRPPTTNVSLCSQRRRPPPSPSSPLCCSSSPSLCRGHPGLQLSFGMQGTLPPRDLHSSPGAAVTTCHTLGGRNDTHLLCHNGRGCKPEIKLSARLVPSRGPTENLSQASLPASGGCQQSRAFLGGKTHHAIACFCLTWSNPVCLH